MPASSYTHLNFSVDPESVGRELHRAIACLLCNGKERCQQVGEYPCAECQETADNRRLLLVLARTLLKAARYGREENTLESFRAAGHAIEYLFEQAQTELTEKEQRRSSTVVSFERAVRAAVGDITEEQLAALQERIITVEHSTLPLLQDQLIAIILGDG